MEADKKYTWYKIAESLSDIPFGANGMAEVTVHGKTICIAMHQQTVLACAQKCPHAGAAMAGGYLDPMGNIVCPLHRYKFNLENGRNISGEGYHLKTFPIEVKPEGIFAGFAENNWLSWLK